MSRLIKYSLSLLLAFGCAESSWAFSLLGEKAEWQVPRIGYLDTEIGGPMNVGEEYRWNTPIVTYGFDESFINYFGTNGILAVEQAFQILNDLPPASQITSDMLHPETSAFPPIVHAENYSASALSVADVKSASLHFLIEELGLAKPERYVYTIRSRTTFSDPDYTNWVVIQRNFDPLSFQPTNRINDVYYTYTGILETKSPDRDFPRITQVTLEPGAGTVAGGRIIGSPGFYYPGTNAATALTRDDVGGLRYLLHPSNLNVENLPPGTEEVFTNSMNPIVLTNYDFGLLIRATIGTTNTPAQVQAQFPGITITGTNSYLTNLIVTNISSYFTNYPYGLDEPLQQVITTNFTTNVVQVYNYSVGNIVTNSSGFGRLVTDRVYEIVPAPDYTPGGSAIRTNIISESTYFTNLPNGSFYVVPTNIIEFIVATNAPIPITVLETNVILSTTVDSLPYVDLLAPPITIKTLDYYRLYTNSVRTTNTATQLKALPGYADLLILETTAYAGFIVTTNITTYFVNYPWSPRQVFSTNYQTNDVTFYDYVLGNIVVDPYFPAEIGRPVDVRTYEIVPAEDYSPGLGGVRTNLLESYSDTQHVENGEFLIFPLTNTASGRPLLGYTNARLIRTEVTATTNLERFITANYALHTNDTLGLVVTTDLTTFSEQARTNAPEAFKGLYPNLLILSSNRFFSTEIVTNSVYYFTNSEWSTAGFLSLTQQLHYETNVMTNWVYTFGNVVTNFGSTNPIATNGLLIIEENLIGYYPYSPAGGPEVTNVVITVTNWNVPVGNIYVVPTNLFGYSFDTNEFFFTKVVPVTNTVVITNLVSNIIQTNTIHYIRYETNFFIAAYPIELWGTNELQTNIFGIQKEVVSYATNRTFEVTPVDLITLGQFTNQIFGERREQTFYFTNSIITALPVQTRPPIYDVALRPGIDKITFVRVDYDSGTGTNRINYTNSYIDTVIISNSVVKQAVRKVLTRPDIVFGAADLGLFPDGEPVFYRRSIAFQNNNVLNGDVDLDGPGQIVPPISIQFSKVGPYYDNNHQGDRFDQDLSPLYRWGSFDSTTNIIVYPVGTSAEDVEQQVLIP